MPRFILPIVKLFAVCAMVAGQSQQPNDAVFSEKELNDFLAAAQAGLALNNIPKAPEDGRSLGAWAASAGADEKFRKIITDQGMAVEDFCRLAELAGHAWAVIAAEDLAQQAENQLQNHLQQNAQRVELLERTIAQQETALNSQMREPSAEQRQALVDMASQEYRTALDEQAEHLAAARVAAEEAAQADALAAEITRTLGYPPPDLSQEDQFAWIAQQNQALAAARESSAQAKAREQEFRQAAARCQVRADAARRRIDNPDLPLTDEEKARFLQQTQQSIQRARDELATLTQETRQLEQSAKAAREKADQLRSRTPGRNVALVRKHRAEFEEIFRLKLSQ